MRSLERRFNNIANKNPFWSSYIYFAEAIKEQKFSKQTIVRYFNKLVDKDNYDKKDKREIIRQLCELSQSPVKTGEKQELRSIKIS